jgi:hypothetical protein
LGDSIHIITEKTGAVLVTCKGIGREANAEKTEYMSMSRGQNAGQNHNIKIDNKFLLMCGIVQIFGNNINKSKSHS